MFTRDQGPQEKIKRWAPPPQISNHFWGALSIRVLVLTSSTFPVTVSLPSISTDTGQPPLRSVTDLFYARGPGGLCDSVVPSSLSRKGTFLLFGVQENAGVCGSPLSGANVPSPCGEHFQQPWTNGLLCLKLGGKVLTRNSCLFIWWISYFSCLVLSCKKSIKL